MRLHRAGADLVVVNTHYLANQVETFINTTALPVPVKVSHEDILAGTGGGIAAAKAWLTADDPFILHNSDAFITTNLQQLIRKFNTLRPAAMLMVTRDPSRPDAHVVGVVPQNKTLKITTFRARPDDGLRHYMYTGIAVISRRIFDFLPKGPSCLIKNGLEPMIAAGLPVLAFNYNGTFVDIGTPAGLLRAQKVAFQHTPKILQDNGLPAPVRVKPGVFCMDKMPKAIQTNPPVFIGYGIRTENDVTLGPNAFISNDVNITGPTRVKDCLILPGASISGHVQGPVTG